MALNEKTVRLRVRQALSNPTDRNLDLAEQALDLAEQAPAKMAVKSASVAKLADYSPRVEVVQRGTKFTSHEKAYCFAQFVRAALFENSFAESWCKTRGIKTQLESQNTVGGYLVPEGASAALLELREKYGTFRQYCRVVPVVSEVTLIPRRDGALTVFPIGEGVAITESAMVFDAVQCVCRKWGILTAMSTEVSEDSIANFGDVLANEISFAFANLEDTLGFAADGTSAFHSVTGVCTALTNLSGTVANIAGVEVGSGSGYSGLTYANFQALVSRLPAFADNQNTRFFCHRNFFWSTMAPLATGQNILMQDGQPLFLGFKVAFAQTMPHSTASSQICCLFGDLSKAAILADRRRVELKLSPHVQFPTGQTLLRATARFAVNVHDVGNFSATPADRVAGPIVGLITG